MKVIDCYSISRHYSHIECIFSPPVSQEEIGNAIWSMINVAFTKPVTNADQSSDYVPTQILAEYFKSEGFDGVFYKSGMGQGHNFILFNMNDAELISCKIMEAAEISFKFEESGARCYVRRPVQA